jgi:hypothetical protein
MNSEGNCFGKTGGGSHDAFNTPLDEKGFSILTGMSRGDGKEMKFTLVGLETYHLEFA